MARLDRVKERLEVWRHHCVDYRTQCTPAAWKFINQEYGPQPKSLKDAAKFFGLSLANKAELALLLRILADIIFAPRKRGRKEESRHWNDKRLFALGERVCQLEKQFGRRLSDRTAAKMIVSFYPHEYQSWEVVRQRMKDVRAAPSPYVDAAVVVKYGKIMVPSDVRRFRVRASKTASRHPN